MNTRKRLKRRLDADRARPLTNRRIKALVDAEMQTFCREFTERSLAAWRRMGLIKDDGGAGAQ